VVRHCHLDPRPGSSCAPVCSTRFTVMIRCSDCRRQRTDASEPSL
jgi:hypothetical protein